MKIFQKDMIKFVDKVNDWREALNLATKPLLENGYINEAFLKLLIRETERLGPYYILTNDLALAHISPNNSILKNGLSLLYLNEPVDFKTNGTGNVKFLFVLTAIDSSSHLEILKELSKAFSNKKFYDEFYNVKSYEDIEELIKIL